MVTPGTPNSSGDTVLKAKGGDCPEHSGTYFGVCFPDDFKSDDQLDGIKVFTDIVAASKIAKKVKGSRFKVFKSKSEAANFASQSPAKAAIKPSESSPQEELPTKPVAGESLPFPSLRTQDLVQLRRAIEQNNVDKFKELVWSNPRYLVSSGDTPTLLQEGFRYNGMHSAALKNRADMASLLLETIEDPSFLAKLYVNDTEVTRNKRMNFLVDLYLNTPDKPDKGFSETPLHFACKFGHIDVIKVLASHPMTNKRAVNRDGKTAAECGVNEEKIPFGTNEVTVRRYVYNCFGQKIACSRMSNPPENLKREILLELEDHFYVPLWRSEDNTSQPMIGEPWSPTDNHTWPESPVITSPLSPIFNESPMSVKAFAGPMSPCKAAEFHKNWSTPPRNSSLSAKRSFHDIKRQDSDKGLERIGRDLARTYNTPWTEYWPFLQCSIDISSIAGLEKLDQYLEDKYKDASCQNDFSGSDHMNTTVNKTPENSPATGDQILKTPNSVDRKLDDVIDALSSLRIHSPSGEVIGDGVPRLDGSIKNKKDFSSSSENSGENLPSTNKLAVSSARYSSLEYIVPALSPALRRVKSVFTGFWRKENDQRSQELKNAKNEPNKMDGTDTILKTPVKATSAKLIPVYINGRQPTKIDVDVLRAIEKVKIPDTFSHVQQWKRLVTKSSDEERKSWRTPCRTQPREPHMIRRSKLTLDRDLQMNLMEQFSSSENL